MGEASASRARADRAVPRRPRPPPPPKPASAPSRSVDLATVAVLPQEEAVGSGRSKCGRSCAMNESGATEEMHESDASDVSDILGSRSYFEEHQRAAAKVARRDVGSARGGGRVRGIAGGRGRGRGSASGRGRGREVQRGGSASGRGRGREVQRVGGRRKPTSASPGSVAQDSGLGQVAVEEEDALRSYLASTEAKRTSVEEMKGRVEAELVPSMDIGIRLDPRLPPPPPRNAMRSARCGGVRPAAPDATNVPKPLLPDGDPTSPTSPAQRGTDDDDDFVQPPPNMSRARQVRNAITDVVGWVGGVVTTTDWRRRSSSAGATTRQTTDRLSLETQP